MPINQNFVLKAVGKEYMIIPLAEGGLNFSKVYNISATGALIFKLLQENHTLEQIVENIINEYEVEYEKALKDTKEFIKELKKRGIYND